jgi:Fe-S-cluster-containing hydrogenase component 2
MALRIEVDLCTACGDCVPVCPEAAIFIHRLVVDIVADRCNECDGHADEPLCVAVCPVDDCIVGAIL